MKKLLVILFFVAGINVHSQNADLIIKVIDAVTGETLTGVNVSMVGIGNFSSDFDGNIIVNDITQGVYDFHCESLSYSPKNISEFKVLSGEINSLIIELDDINTLIETGSLSLAAPAGEVSK